MFWAYAIIRYIYNRKKTHLKRYEHVYIFVTRFALVPSSYLIFCTKKVFSMPIRKFVILNSFVLIKKLTVMISNHDETVILFEIRYQLI